MKEYKFEYTKIISEVAVLFVTILLSILPLILGLEFHANLLFLLLSSLVVAVVSFYFLKRLIILQGQALLDENSVTFIFKDYVKKIDFDSLTSYKTYLGTTISMLKLNNTTMKFKIFANNNFCNSDDFNVLCDELVLNLNEYKLKYNNALIHESSMLGTKKGLHYFLIFSSLIYFSSLFIISDKTVKTWVGVGVGLYLLLLWIVYFNKKDEVN